MSALQLTSDQWTETLIAIAILGIAILVALVVPRLIAALLRRCIGTSGATDLAVRTLHGPLGVLIVVQTFFVVLRRLSYLHNGWHMVDRAWIAFTIIVVVYGLQRLIVPLTQWYANRSVATRAKLHSLPPLQRALRVVIWVAGFLMVLATLGIEISPLLAGLGLGGLAVALALQPMLANIFASSFLLSDQSIRIGDAIQVQGGPSGTIEDIGWRATRIRSADNNIVLVPNSVLAQATMTNFDSTTPETDVLLVLHVSTAEDLVAVQDACLDEMSRMCDEESELVAGGGSIAFRYQGVEAGKAEIQLRVRATSWRDAADVRHRMILRIHSRLLSEGVTLA
ncbi:MAG: mechanosensitive ion channel family protein [Chloroflexi bacterium]|nr:MAG: mechanosensitive ion channel family protein [Chloroflexota bacterium]